MRPRPGSKIARWIGDRLFFGYGDGATPHVVEFDDTGWPVGTYALSSGIPLPPTGILEVDGKAVVFVSDGGMLEFHRFGFDSTIPVHMDTAAGRGGYTAAALSDRRILMLEATRAGGTLDVAQLTCPGAAL